MSPAACWPPTSEGSSATTPHAAAARPPPLSTGKSDVPPGVKVLRPSQSPPVPSRVGSAHLGAHGPSSVSRKAPFATVSFDEQHVTTAAAAASPRAASAASPSRFAGQGSFARTPSQLQTLGGIKASAQPNAPNPGAAGQATAEFNQSRLPGNLPAMYAPLRHTSASPLAAGDAAAGRTMSTLTARERMYGGQIAHLGIGGLG